MPNRCLGAKRLNPAAHGAIENFDRFDQLDLKSMEAPVPVFCGVQLIRSWYGCNLDVQLAKDAQSPVHCLGNTADICSNDKASTCERLEHHVRTTFHLTRQSDQIGSRPPGGGFAKVAAWHEVNVSRRIFASDATVNDRLVLSRAYHEDIMFGRWGCSASAASTISHKPFFTSIRPM